MECTYLNGWIKNGHLRKNLTQNSEPQRSSWGTKKKRSKERQLHNLQHKNVPIQQKDEH